MTKRRSCLTTAMPWGPGIAAQWLLPETAKRLRAIKFPGKFVSPR